MLVRSAFDHPGRAPLSDLYTEIALTPAPWLRWEVFHRFDPHGARQPEINTALEFVVLASVIADAAAMLDAGAMLPLLFALVFATVFASGAQYVWIWGRRALVMRRARLTGAG